MTRDKQHRIVNGLLALTLIWILNSCVYQQAPLKPAPEEPPPPVEIKPGTKVLESVTPVTPESERTVVPPKPPGFYLHKVRWTEETYSHISKWYTGTVNNWKAIAKANPELDPKNIDIGDTIFIPEGLMTSIKPMPHSFVRPSVRKKGTPRASPQKASTPSESPKLFSPVESNAVELFGPIDTEASSEKTDATKLFDPIE